MSKTPKDHPVVSTEQLEYMAINDRPGTVLGPPMTVSELGQMLIRIQEGRAGNPCIGCVGDDCAIVMTAGDPPPERDSRLDCERYVKWIKEQGA